MPMINSFGVIGGDERMRYLAASIAADGYPVCAYGFENSGPIRGVAETSLPDLVKRSAVILLPLPATRDGETLLAPFAAEPIRLNDDFAAQLCNRTVYGGMIQKLTASSAIWKEIEPEDYYRREELAVGNAIATAEGAVAAAVGRPKAARAVGNANNKNPILIFTPCHRVVGADGALVGFAAGLPVKEALLALERKYR